MESSAVESPAEVLVAVNPATGERLADVPAVTPAQLADALRRARRAQRDWGARPARERLLAMRSLLELLVRRRDDLAAAVARETGKPRLEALTAEVLPVLDHLDFLLREGEALLAPRPLRHRLLRSVRSTVRRVPYGVVGVITPWNYPLFLAASAGFAALAAGNAVLNKPSELAPLVGLELEKLLRDAGLPPALWQCLPGNGEVGAALVEAGCDKICFTGSVETGRRVAAACGERLVPCTLELGGKDAALVFADADLERAVPALVWGSFTNCGQVCASVERIYVEDSIAHEFTRRFVEQTARLRVGTEAEGDFDLGPLVCRAQFEKVRAQVEEARAAGAAVLVGGQGRPGEGEKARYFYEPTVLGGVSSRLRALREESFGPLVAVVPVGGEEEAVQAANASPYGLTASVWTQDPARAERVAARLQVGSVFVNEVLAPSGAGEAPWGGVKDSGYGKTRGAEGLLEMTRAQHVAMDRFGVRRAPFWFPYTRRKYELVSSFVPALFGGSPTVRLKAGIKGMLGLLGRRTGGDPAS
ncbi:MAG: aldehyde dehydrogenase family protein [Planctomycetota bacterium]|nr:MAG: aldehyde dehydrogenase family protein [Planctomycetota bacterium]